MSQILAVALESMHQDSVRLERVGMNLANAMTPGYKREVVSVQPREYASMVSPFAEQLNIFSAQMQAGEAVAVKVQTDTRPGTLKSTGQSLDLAIAGQGYFEVSTDSGPAYTRQGNFRLDSRGRLVTAQGHAVMGKGGEISLGAGSPTIDALGFIYDGAQSGAVNSRSVAGKGSVGEQQAIAQIKVVNFESSQTFTRLGDGLFSVEGEALSLKDSEVQLRQGFLENSNVSSMQEMVQMMQTMRHFESMQKVAVGYDEMMGTAIKKLGDVS